MSDSHDMKAPTCIRWLIFRVHVDAFLSAPLTYVRAIIWRIRGLRLRSRNTIAALTGRSRHAYRLWMVAREPGRFAEADLSGTSGTHPILVVVNGMQGLERAAHTIQSIRASDSLARIIILAPQQQQQCFGSEKEFADILWFETASDMADGLADLSAYWLCVLKPGDRLAPQALPCYAKAVVRHRDAHVVYADDDLLRDDGDRHSPHFKPEWNSELYRHHDYLSGACIICVEQHSLRNARSMEWWEEMVKEAAAHDGAPPVHLPLILHHRRDRPQPRLPAARSAGATDQLPAITVIIPTRNQLALLRKCMEGVANSEYPRLQRIIIDNDSDDPETLAYLQQLSTEVDLIRFGGPFNFSAMNNAAVQKATGQLLCFLNNDIEMIRTDWLHYLAAQASRPAVGAVGAKLLYPDHMIQHAGVVIGVGGGAAHAHRNSPDTSPGYFSRPHLPQFVSAVTAACMMVERNKFLAVGGFDAENFAVAFNDIDLCLKLNARGWQSFYEPRAKLIHHESKSRGSDRTKANKPRFEREFAALKRIWNTDKVRDPYHNENLSKFTEQFLIDL